MTFKIEIPSRSRRCCIGDEDFQQGMEYYSVLEEGRQEAYERKDYCITCWNLNSYSQGKAFWKSKVPVKKQNAVDDRGESEKALDLLKQTTDEAESFILALLLQRKKLIHLKKEMAEMNGDVVFLYEIIQTEEILRIKKVNLSSQEIEKVQTALATKLYERSSG